MIIRLIFIIISLLLLISECAQTPSLTEIKSLRNSELDEIFSEAVQKPPPPETENSSGIPYSAELPPPPQPSNQGFMGRYNRPSGPREVPINHAHALGPQQPPPVQQGGVTNNDLNELAQQGANVFATGANAFYRGAATVGQAFGIPSGNYQVPILSQAASLFGR